MLYIPYENIDLDPNQGILFKFRNKTVMFSALLRLECYGIFKRNKRKAVAELIVYFIPIYNGRYINTKTGLGFYINLNDVGGYPVSYLNTKRFMDINNLNGKLLFKVGYFSENRYTLIATADIEDYDTSSFDTYTLEELKDSYFTFSKPSQVYMDRKLSDTNNVSIFSLS